MVNGKQHSVWFVPTGMKGLPQNVLLNFRLEIPKSDLAIYLPSGISEIFFQMVSTPGRWTQPLPGALSIQPKIPVISVGTSNGTDHFGLVRPEYSGSALKVVLFDRSGHFGRSDRNVPFHLTKLLSPVPLFCILLQRTITKRAVAWVGSVEPECTVPLNTENFRNFKPEFLLNGKRLGCPKISDIRSRMCRR